MEMGNGRSRENRETAPSEDPREIIGAEILSFKRDIVPNCSFSSQMPKRRSIKEKYRYVSHAVHSISTENEMAKCKIGNLE